VGKDGCAGVGVFALRIIAKLAATEASPPAEPVAFEFLGPLTWNQRPLI
jgi:hypothetical protein